MTKLQEELLKACQVLNVKIELDFTIILKNGRKIQVAARIPSLGGRNGMIIVSSYGEVDSIWDDLIKDGYGISVLDEPDDNEEFDLNACKDMFIDWGLHEELNSSHPEQ